MDCAEQLPHMKTIVGVLMHAVDETIYVQRPAGKILAPNPEILAAAKERGVVFYQGVHSLGGSVASAVQREMGGMPMVEIIAQTYKTISTGTKVAVESILMAADAGHLDMQQEVVSLGGWKGGADTAIVARPAYAHSYLDFRIREFIALPRQGDS